MYLKMSHVFVSMLSQYIILFFYFSHFENFIMPFSEIHDGIQAFPEFLRHSFWILIDDIVKVQFTYPVFFQKVIISCFSPFFVHSCICHIVIKMISESGILCNSQSSQFGWELVEMVYFTVSRDDMVNNVYYFVSLIM